MAEPIRVNLIVIKSNTPDSVVRFYKLLGLSLQQEQHGQGGIHWSAAIGQTTFEIYPHPNSGAVDALTRLGFEIPDLNATLESLRAAQFEVISEAKPSLGACVPLFKIPTAVPSN